MSSQNNNSVGDNSSNVINISTGDITIGNITINSNNNSGSSGTGSVTAGFYKPDLILTLDLSPAPPLTVELVQEALFSETLFKNNDVVITSGAFNITNPGPGTLAAGNIILVSFKAPTPIVDATLVDGVVQVLFGSGGFQTDEAVLGGYGFVGDAEVLDAGLLLQVTLTTVVPMLVGDVFAVNYTIQYGTESPLSN